MARGFSAAENQPLIAKGRGIDINGMFITQKDLDSTPGLGELLQKTLSDEKVWRAAQKAEETQESKLALKKAYASFVDSSQKLAEAYPGSKENLRVKAWEKEKQKVKDAIETKLELPAGFQKPTIQGMERVEHAGQYKSAMDTVYKAYKTLKDAGFKELAENYFKKAAPIARMHEQLKRMAEQPEFKGLNLYGKVLEITGKVVDFGEWFNRDDQYDSIIGGD